MAFPFLYDFLNTKLFFFLSLVFFFFVNLLWHINLHGLFNGKAILVVEQHLYFLTHCWIIIFPDLIQVKIKTNWHHDFC